MIRIKQSVQCITRYNDSIIQEHILIADWEIPTQDCWMESVCWQMGAHDMVSTSSCSHTPQHCNKIKTIKQYWHKRVHSIKQIMFTRQLRSPLKANLPQHSCYLVSTTLVSLLQDCLWSRPDTMLDNERSSPSPPLKQHRRWASWWTNKPSPSRSIQPPTKTSFKIKQAMKTNSLWSKTI